MLHAAIAVKLVYKKNYVCIIETLVPSWNKYHVHFCSFRFKFRQLSMVHGPSFEPSDPITWGRRAQVHMILYERNSGQCPSEDIKTRALIHLLNKCKCKCVCLSDSDIPLISADLNLHPWHWNSHLYGFTSSGENSAHFLQLIPFKILHFSFHQVPITAGWTDSA